MHLSSNFELSKDYWNNHDQGVANILSSPVLQFIFVHRNPLFKPYAELNIGIACLSEQ